MILHTAFKDVASNTPLENGTRFEGVYGVMTEFTCHCGRFFKLNRNNKFITSSELECPRCKRGKLMLPEIGERYIYKRIRYDAKRYGRSFNLSFDWVSRSIHLPCHYCGRSDINRAKVASKIPGVFLIENFRYNGIDRIDNAIGYEYDNCVPCCVVCNRAKNSMSYDDFMEYVGSLINHQSSLGEENGHLRAARVQYRGRHGKTGDGVDSKELPEDSISPSVTGPMWDYLYPSSCTRYCIPQALFTISSEGNLSAQALPSP